MSGRRVRAELVHSGALRAVIALPAAASVPLHVGLQMWVPQRPEPGGSERKSVLFVDTATDTSAAAGHGGAAVTARTRGGSRSASVDSEGITARALGASRAFVESPDTCEGEPGVAQAADVVDLLDDVVHLTPARLIRASRVHIDPAELSAEADRGQRLPSRDAISTPPPTETLYKFFTCRG
ncbi:hypothetical protein [Streptomyces griseoluteus]|uniref:hypothetical protein n=1 Tax=Streptomyces griseoluteus TaxID=29306 RepID=UPI0036FD5521